MNRAVLEADTLFLHAFDHAAIGMAIVDLQGYFLHVNKPLCQLTGYSESELRGKTYEDITHPDDLGCNHPKVQALRSGQIESFQTEKRYIHRDGYHIWVLLSVSAVRDEAGSVRFIIAQMQNISDRKRTENVLKAHMQQYKSLFEHNPDIVYAVSLDGHLQSINASAERMTGFPGEDWFEFAPKELKAHIRQAIGMAYEGYREALQLETSLVHRDGRTVYVSVTHMPIVVDGEAVGIYGIVKDITKQVLLIRHVKESEKKYRLLAEHSLDMIVRTNPFGVFTYVSPSSKTLLGYEPEELEGKQTIPLVHPEDLEEQQAYFGRLKHVPDERVYTLRLRHKDGHYVWVEARVKSVRGPSGKVTENIGIMRDVTERVLERQKLREAEELFQLISNHSQDLITWSDADGIVRYASPAVTRLLGYAPEDIVGHHMHPLYHPDDIAALERRSYSDEDVFWCRVRHKDGRYIWLETAVKFIRDARGNLEKILGISRDVSGRKAAEQEIRKREEQYRTLVEHSPDAILVGVEGKIVYANETAVKLLGAGSKDELLATEPIRLVHPDYQAAALERKKIVENQGVAELTEFKYIRVDGKEIEVEVKSLPTLYADKPAVHTIVRDISTRKQTQAQLEQSEKLAIAGQLAAGIAHEIRNPLTALKGFLKLMKNGQAYKPQYLDIMSEELIRMERILNELLTLAKPQSAYFAAKEIASVARDVVRLLEPQAMLRNVEIRCEMPEAPLVVRCDENHLKQAFINVLKNAVEASPDGAEIVVAVVADGGEAHVRFSDRGCGIPEEQLPFVGQPFFTTKDRGTGLGLSVSYRIVESHGGRVTVVSRVNEGTTFCVALPLVGTE